MTELPLRIIDQAGGLTVRCLCGAEAAVVQGSAELSGPFVRAGRARPAANRGISGDVSPAAVLRMAAHAKRCVPGQNGARER